MCGLVGVAGDMTLDAVKVFKQLLWVDTLRGEDSTGVAAIGINGLSINIIKALGSAEYLLGTKRFLDEVNAGKYALIGHNRFGTVGAKSVTNAHPFTHGDITGAHNGTLPYDARKRLGTQDDFGTDSEQIIHSLSERGVVDTVGLINGAWAVTFYDKNNNSINFFRNKERDLWYAFSTDKKQIFWASEPGMLMWILSRNGIKYEKVHQVPVDKYVSFIIPKTSQVFNTEEGVIADLKEHTAPTVVSRFHGGGPYNWRPDPEAAKKTGEKTEKRGEVVPFGKDGGSGNPPSLVDVPWPADSDLEDDELEKRAMLAIFGWQKDTEKEPKVNYPTLKTYVNPRTGVLMTKAEFDDFTSAGCDWCSSNIEFGSNARFVCDAGSGEIECFCEPCVQGNNDLKHYMKV